MHSINIKRKREIADEIPRVVLSALPYRLVAEIEKIFHNGFTDRRIEEIRLRRGHKASLTLSGRNCMLDLVLDGDEIDAALCGMCQGSLYAYSDTISKGYISLPGGIRVGVSGRASCQDGKVIGVNEISSLVIRIPHRTRMLGREICDILYGFKMTRGVLVYSPPGVGKTTLLRGVAALLSSGETPLRTVVIDTRGELGCFADSKELCVDILSGYPKKLGIEIAARTLSAQVIICDEIGDYEEAMALVDSHNCGVPLVASAHGADVSELMSRTGLRLLHESGIFGAYVGISRAGDMNFEYKISQSRDITF